MKYLYKPQTNTLKPLTSGNSAQMSGNLHEDNLKDLDNRTEPMEQSMKPTPPAERYQPDPTTDPDISKRQTTQNDFPGWVFYEYKLDKVNLWNKPWPDGKEHLVPKKQFIANIVGMHIEGENTIGKMIELALMPTNIGNTNILLSAYTTMFVGIDKPYIFPQMQSLGRIAQGALARRAFDKYAYLSAAERWENSQDAKDNKDEPEWLGSMYTRMLEAATQAGTWCRVHSECWHILEWKNNPTYNNVENEIKLLAVNQARWIEDNHGPVQAERPKISDKRALAAAC